MSEAVRLGLALAMLAGAALLDLRSRRVPNPYWVPFAAFAGLLWLGDLGGVAAADGAGWAGGGPRLLWEAGVALATCGLLYLFWWAGAFGGADAKGLMVLAWLLPGLPDLAAGTVTPTADAFVNATFLVLVYPLAFLAVNLARLAAGRQPRLPAAFLGVEMATDRAAARHVWPLQAVDDAGRLRWVLFHRPGQPLDETYARLRAAGVERVWVTPKVPFIVPLLAGLLLAKWIGNAALWFAVRL